MFVFQTTTVATTAMKRAAATPALALSSSVTAAAASQIIGPVMEIMTVEITAMKLMQTAPIEVGVMLRLAIYGEIYWD